MLKRHGNNNKIQFDGLGAINLFLQLIVILVVVMSVFYSAINKIEVVMENHSVRIDSCEEMIKKTSSNIDKLTETVYDHLIEGDS